jgi:hypothetical protein
MKTLAKLLYVEADEEITDLVDRLRDLSLEDAVTFVVPDRSRALQSPMSFRLLKRYADSYGKHVNVISSDPRLQALSLETGFSAYPSLQAYDGGAEVHRPGETADASAEPDVPSFVPPPPAGRRAAVVSGAPRRSAAQDNAPSKRRPAVRDYRAYIIGAVVLAIVGLLALLLYVPTAAVTLSVQGTPLKTDVQLLGSTATPAGPTETFQTQALHASESQTVQGTATGQKQIDPATAKGTVVFTNNFFFPVDFPKETVSTQDGIKFQTQQAVLSVPPGGSTKPIPVVAVNPGSNGNVPKNSITNLDATRGSSPFSSVTNPDATSGGLDARTATVIQQSDIDSIASTYARDAIPKVQDELAAKAAGLHVVPVGSGVGSSVSADRKVGDEVQGPFNVTVTVAGDAVAFDEKKVKSMLKDALTRKVPPGSQLTENPTLTYDATGATKEGNISLKGHASGTYTPVFLQSAIRGRLKGKSPSSAHAFLQSLPNVVDARITETPFSLPFLPLFSSRISLKIVEVAGSPGP